MAELAETVKVAVPHMGATLIYFHHADKTAAEDTITFGDFTTLRYASAMVGTGTENVTLHKASQTSNGMRLMGTATGTVDGIAIVEK